MAAKPLRFNSSLPAVIRALSWVSFSLQSFFVLVSTILWGVRKAHNTNLLVFYVTMFSAYFYKE
jgi:hypothetical protein